MGDATDEVLVAQAVAEAVRRAGTNVVSEPRRIQGMVSDVLGAQARTRRGEIDAVVRAASEQIPERLMSKSIDVDGAVSILTATGLDGATADFAVQVWSYALGLLEAEAEPPTLTRSIENTASRDAESSAISDENSAFGFDDGAVAATVLPESVVVAESDPELEHVAEPEQVVVAEPESVAVPEPEQVAVPEPELDQLAEPERAAETGQVAEPVLPVESAVQIPDPVTEDPTTGPLLVEEDAAEIVALENFAADVEADLPPSERSRTKGRQPVLLGAVGAVVLVVAIAAIALWMSRDSEPTRLSTAEKQASVEFTDAATPVGTVSRTWTVDGDTLVGELVVANRTDKATSGQHYEVVPKSLVPKASAIKSEPAHKVIKDDPVIAWDISLKPKEKAEFRYTIKVDPKTDVKQLNTWKADQNKADKEFAAEREALPNVKVISPAGLQLTENTFTLSGTADPTSTIEIADVKPGGKPAIKAVVKPDGTWSQAISGLGLGENVLKVVATSRFGATSSVSYSVVVQPPVAPPVEVQSEVVTVTPPTGGTSTIRKTPTGRPPSGGGTDTVPPPPPPPVVTTTTAAPKPPISVSISGPSNVWALGSYCYYSNTIHPVGFTPVSISWSAPAKVDRYQGYEYAFSPNTGIAPGTYTIRVTATAPDGRKVSGSKSITAVWDPDASCIE